MVVVSEPQADVKEQIDPPSAVRERAEAFTAEVLAEAMGHPVQMANGGLYVRGLLEQGERKSLEPMVQRLGGEADYQSMQQFLADSPWDPVLVVRAVAERVAPAIDVEAWVLDDTGFPKDGKHSPGVKRQYSGTLGKIGNCQIGVSLHAVGGKSTVPLGWALYLPEEWCKDKERRRKAKIPEEIEFQTKPQLGVKLAVRAAGWKVRKAAVLGDSAYGDNTELRDQLHSQGLQYVLSVSPETTVFSAETKFTLPEPRTGPGRKNNHPRPDRDPESIGQLIARLGEKQRPPQAVSATCARSLASLPVWSSPGGERCSSRGPSPEGEAVAAKGAQARPERAPSSPSRAAICSAGVVHPSVLRGRPLSAAAIASRVAWSWTDRSVPWAGSHAAARWCSRCSRAATASADRRSRPALRSAR